MNIINIPLDKWAGHDPEYKYDERDESIRFIVLHATIGTDSRDWLSKWNRKSPESGQNQVSIHYLIQRDGNIYQIVDEAKRAWHVGLSRMPDGTGDGNSSSIGIELEHMNEPDYTDAQMTALAELVYDITNRRNIAGKNVVSHASVATFKDGKLGRKTDPAHFDWEDLWDRVRKIQEREQAPANVPVSQPYVYTANSSTLNIPVLDEEKIKKYISTKFDKFGEYTQDDIELIVSYYIKYGKQTGVDWLFALAQSIHETGWFKSWWAQRGPANAPRRNPAGIGVTGQTSVATPANPQDWRFDGNVWRKGQGFASWDISVQHHMARLLCYALKDDQMTLEQLEFSKIIPGRERLDRIRGCAPTLIGFNGVWAVPGKTYAQKIAEIANSFVEGATA